MEQKKKVGFRKWWRGVRPTKTVVFWSWIGFVVLTIVVGFAWGGWVTGANAQRLASKMADDAVVERLASICVAQFNQDPASSQKLAVLKETTSYQRREYVQVQGWATIPGEERPNRTVSDACVDLLMMINP